MAMTLPPFLMPLIFQLLAVVQGLIQQAEAAFSGQPGSGDLKKQFVINAATTILESFGTLKPGAMNAEQKAAVINTISSITDSIVMALNTAKLFDAPKPAA